MCESVCRVHLSLPVRFCTMRLSLPVRFCTIRLCLPIRYALLHNTSLSADSLLHNTSLSTESLFAVCTRHLYLPTRFCIVRLCLPIRFAQHISVCRFASARYIAVYRLVIRFLHLTAQKNPRRLPAPPAGLMSAFPTPRARSSPTPRWIPASPPTPLGSLDLADRSVCHSAIASAQYISVCRFASAHCISVSRFASAQYVLVRRFADCLIHPQIPAMSLYLPIRFCTTASLSTDSLLPTASL